MFSSKINPNARPEALHLEINFHHGKAAMSCKSCGSDKQTQLGAEVNIHFPGPKGMDKPAVWAFPKLTVCLDCGFTAFTLPAEELRHLAKGAAA
jgi:hypothetical protein